MTPSSISPRNRPDTAEPRKTRGVGVANPATAARRGLAIPAAAPRRGTPSSAGGDFASRHLGSGGTPAPAPGDSATAQSRAARDGTPLVGTVHSDPDGFSRSLSFFEWFKPDFILVEISDFALKFRKERSAGLKSLFLERLGSVSQKLGIAFDIALAHAQIASILRQISLPFEYCASYAYAERTGAPLVAVDYSPFSRQWIKTWPELISTGNIEMLLGMERAAPPVTSLYARAARRIYEADTFPEALHGDALRWREREKRMARKVAAALRRFAPERPVYIGGWWHLSHGGSIKTLREILGVDETSCFLLDRAGERSRAR